MKHETANLAHYLNLVTNCDPMDLSSEGLGASPQSVDEIA